MTVNPNIVFSLFASAQFHAPHTSAVRLDVFYRFSDEPALQLSTFASDPHHTFDAGGQAHESFCQQQLFQSL
jgi:hypothetical protein